MKIGIDARKIRDFGIGTYLENLLRYLPLYDTENTYVIFHYPDDEDVIPRTGANIRLVSEISPKYSLRELIALPIKMRRQRLDLFHAPHYTLPPVRPCKAVVTIHDVIHLRFPQYLPHRGAYYYAKGMMRLAAASAYKVLTVSQCSKQDIMTYLGVPDEKIAVIYNGIDRPEPEHIRSALSVEERFGISGPYLLYLGNFMPHKNLETLIEAFNLLRNQGKYPHKLVLAGKNDRLQVALRALIRRKHLEHEVILTGFVEPQWKSALYANADLFVYPSLYEGFGLQALEAMAHQVPVVISDIAALTEIAGDAALRCDPKSAQSMAEVIGTALSDRAARNTLLERGTARVQVFSWRECVRKTVKIYHDALLDEAS